jgi:cytochrome c
MLAPLAMIAILCVGVTTARAGPPDIVQAGRAPHLARCGGCHAVDSNGVGRMDRDLVGRPVAARTSYRVSPSLERLGGVRTPERLDASLRDPQAVAPGAPMTLSIADADARRALIPFLATVSDTAPEPLIWS